MELDQLAAEHRNRLVDSLVSSGAVVSSPVEQAMRRVPRHRLLRDVWLPPVEDRLDFDRLAHHHVGAEQIDPEILARIYEDVAIPTKMSAGRPASSTSQPSLVAHMLELLDLQPGMRVLEIGAGTGYNAALMAEIVGDPSLVHTIDISQDVVDQTRESLTRTGYGDIAVIQADGAEGHAEGAPYDRLVATVGCTDIAQAWLEQLAPSEFALVPLAHASLHPLTRIGPSGNGARGQVVGSAGFMRIQGTLDRPLLWPEPSTAEDRREPLPDEMLTARGDTRWPGWDAHYYLSLVEPRATRGVALADQAGAIRVDFATSELVHTGRTDELREVLVAHVRAWHALDRPRAGDWRSNFTPLQHGHNTDPHAHRVERVQFLQTVTLPRRDAHSEPRVNRGP